MRIHFIGIGGVGMSAVAALCVERGDTVTGSDEAVYPPVSDTLTDRGISYHTPYGPENIPEGVECIVIGKNAKLHPETNSEVAHAMTLGVRIASFPEILAEIAQKKEQYIVVGSYGKSTSVSLLAHILTEAGVDPSFMIGAQPLTPPTSSHLGTGTPFIIEGDEYPSSHTDNRSKFLHFSPSHLLVTPLAHDHLNVFPTEDSYLIPFFEIKQRVDPKGACIVATSGALSERFLSNIDAPYETYGPSGNWRAGDVSLGDTTTFTLIHNDIPVATLETALLGLHNVENIVGVSALLLSTKAVSVDDLVRGVASFRGLRRRLDLKTDKSSVRIYEGFGSSIDKAKAAIAAMKLHFPNRRLVIVFEPHTFSWRNRGALPWYDSVFSGADLVYIYEPETQGADTHDQVTLEEITERVRGSGIETVGFSNAAIGLTSLSEHLHKDDVVLILTSGDMDGMVRSIPELAETIFPAQ